MRPEKPDHSSSNKAFIAMGICIFIGAMSFEHNIPGLIPVFAIILVYILPIYGIIKRKKENKAFKEEVKKYDAAMRLQAEQEKIKKELMFEKETMCLSTKYAQSPLTQDIVNWMMHNVSKEITSADRKNYVEIIQVTLRFDVCMKEITCWKNATKDVYDFIQNRYELLQTPVEKAALARALGTATKISIEEKYPKDFSGTKPTVSVTYDDRQGWNEKYLTTVTITYSAPNGYFVPAQKW